MRVLAALVLLPAVVLAAPTVVQRDNSILTLDAAQFDVYSPYAFLAAAGYCDPRITKDWQCGPNCEGVPDFVPTAVGGDGYLTQFWYVGFHPTLDSVVVGHQGTKPTNIIPLLTDANFILDNPDNTTFPGLSDAGILIHNGFLEQHDRSFSGILAAVKETLAKHHTKNVVVTGHSLGAAISVLDAVALQLALPKDTTFRIVTFGQSRVGNQEFADYVDAHFKDIVRVTNKHDLVPTIPGRFLGYHHFSGEIHIKKDDSVVLCHGQDNTGCIIKDVPTIFSSSLNDHKGPYLGILMKCPANDDIPDDGLFRRSDSDGAFFL